MTNLQKCDKAGQAFMQDVYAPESGWPLASRACLACRSKDGCCLSVPAPSIALPHAASTNTPWHAQHVMCKSHDAMQY